MANTSIPLQVQPIKIPDQLEGYQKVMTLRALLGQQKLQGLQINQAERGMARQARRDEIAKQSGGDLGTMRDLLAKEGYVDEALDIDTKLTQRLTALRQADEAQFKLGKEKNQSAAQLLMAVKQSQNPASIWPAVRAKAVASGLMDPNDPEYPQAWTPQLMQFIDRDITQAMQLDKAFERADYAALGQPPAAPAAPATMSQYVNQPTDVPHFTGPKAQKLPYSEDAVAMMNQLPPDEAAMQSSLATSGQGAAPTVQTEGFVRPKVTADDYRKEAARLQAKGTKPAFEQAKVYLDEANRMDERIWKERDMQQPVAGAPGVTFNKNTGIYEMDGKPVSAEKVQAIADRNRKAGATNINLAENKYAEKFGGGFAERDIAKYDEAISAADSAEKLDSVISHLETSDAITGLGADLFKNIERAKTLLLNDQKAGKKVSDTELLNAFLGSDVFPMIKALGIGARGLDTPAEREFLREVMSGTVQMNKTTLVKMAKIRRDIAARAVDRWNERVKTIPGEALEGAGLSRDPIRIPSKIAPQESSAPRGVDQKLWDVMTPEEKKLWQN